MNEMTTWFDELKKAFKDNNDNIYNMITTLTHTQLNASFFMEAHLAGGVLLWDDDESIVLTLNSDGSATFNAWSDEYVYFPVQYDTGCFIEWVPRNPTLLLKKAEK